VEFGLSGTIYDAAPAHPVVYKVGSPDLEEQLGAGFQAAHIWVNNQSNQSLYLADAPDVVPPGMTRVVAIRNTDVARASWTLPAGFVQQPGPASGAAIIIWLNAGIDIAPTPGVANQPIVSIASGQGISIVGNPTVTIGPSSNVIGAISSVNSTVTVAGTINIGNTPSVSISGTPTVNIGNTPNVAVTGTVSVSIVAGSVSISGTPNINIQSQSVNVAVNQPQTQLADLSFPGSATTTLTTAAVPSGTHALMLINGNLQSLHHLTVVGHTTGTNYLPIDKSVNSVVLGSLDIIVVTIASTLDSQYDVTLTNPVAAVAPLKVIAMLDASAVWVQNTSKQPLFNWQTTRPYDFEAFTNPAAGSQAIITAAASLQGRWMCQMLHAYSGNNSTTGSIQNVRISDSATGGTNQKYGNGIGESGAIGASDHITGPDMAVIGTFNTQMTIDFAVGVTNIQEKLSVGLHLMQSG
jgi:hypothetical protein